MESAEKTRRLIIFALILIPVLIIAAILGSRYLTEGQAQPEKIQPAGSTGLLQPGGTESGILSQISLELSSAEPENGRDAAEEETIALPDGIALGENTVPEIQEMFTGYFNAKLSGDAARANSYFDGETGDAQDSEREEAELAWSLKYIEDYQDILCYTVPGPEEESYVVYVYYKTKFYQSNTAAPSLSAAYVRKDPDGIYRICSTMRNTEVSYMKAAAGLQSVQELTRTVQEEFRQALASDAGLLKIYEIMTAGPDGETSPGVQ